MHEEVEEWVREDDWEARADRRQHEDCVGARTLVPQVGEEPRERAREESEEREGDDGVRERLHVRRHSRGAAGDGQRPPSHRPLRGERLDREEHDDAERGVGWEIDIRRRGVRLDERHGEKSEDGEVRRHAKAPPREPREEGDAGEGEEVRGLGATGDPPEEPLDALAEAGKPAKRATFAGWKTKSSGVENPSEAAGEREVVIEAVPGLRDVVEGGEEGGEEDGSGKEGKGGVEEGGSAASAGGGEARRRGLRGRPLPRPFPPSAPHLRPFPPISGGREGSGGGSGDTGDDR